MEEKVTRRKEAVTLKLRREERHVAAVCPKSWGKGLDALDETRTASWWKRMKTMMDCTHDAYWKIVTVNSGLSHQHAEQNTIQEGSPHLILEC